jgi:hypothetical protein
MLKCFVKALAVSGMATLAYTTTAVITSAPAAAQFRGGYALDDNDDVFDHRPARGRIEFDEEDEAPRVVRQIVEHHVVRPIVERRIIEREIVQPIVERTVVHRVVQLVYQRPIVKKVVVVHRPIVRRMHFVHRPWHERRRCFLPERYLCG